ncbi:DMT family transporter [Cellulomonas sp. GbtcB1]|uniref:DMT family transporter n=1 Tax=Cellulomonas sp. GbtcB1 TaxID=2824746 RepID=UPI0027DF0D07|nr:DMT family transporter [Cellulomonas sp. GbtcB1]
MPLPARTGPVLALVGATLFWAGNYVLGAVAVQDMTPVSLTALRWALAAVPLAVIAQVVERPDWRAVLRTWPRQVVLALLGMVGYALFVYTALQHTSSVNASLVNALNPALIALLGAAVVRRAPSGRAVAGMLVGLVGVLVVLTGGRLGALTSLELNVGDLLMVGAIVVWSVYTIGGRGLAGVPPIASTAVQAAIAAVVMAPFAATGHVHWPSGRDATVALVVIAVLPSVGSYLLWNLALRRVPPAEAGSYLNLITVFTVLISAATGYALGAAQVVGGVLVLGGVLLVRDRAPRAASPTASDPAGRVAGHAGETVRDVRPAGDVPRVPADGRRGD